MSTPAALVTKLSIDGIVRKVALVTVTLSAIGYLIFVIGWGTFLRSSHSDGSQIGVFAYWYCVAAGPLVFICCLLRVVLFLQANAHYVLMVITFIFISSYISAGGFILYNIGAVVDAFNRIGYTGVYLHEVNAIFAGMMITQIFSMVTGAVLGFIDVKRGKELQTA
ncbi:hypothetical protein EMCRGX_G003899 [Ephydatia muelleri]|eukprot:Em0001g3683a